MFASVLFIVLLNLLVNCNTKNVLSREILNSRISEPGELIDCLQYVTDAFVGRYTVILIEEEIRHISWINTFLKNSEKPTIIVSHNEDLSNLFGFYILFPEYEPEKTQLFIRTNYVKNKFLAVWIDTVSNNSLQSIFERFWSNRCTNILSLATLGKHENFKLYSFSAYSECECGSVKTVLIDEWNRTSRSLIRNANFYENNSLNFHKCVLKVLYNHNPPDSVMNISLEMYNWTVSGVSKKLLEIAEEYFNFSSSIHSTTFGVKLYHSWYYYTEELDFICDTVRKEVVDFASGWFSYSAIEMDNLNSRGVELGTVTSIDCFGWVVPLRAGVKPPNSAYFTEEFGLHMWILIFVTFCSTSLVLHRILRRSLSFVTLVIIQTGFEQPVHDQSRFRKSNFRILFANFCFYSLVVSAAYKASFASFITVSLPGKDFSTVREITESSLKWYGSPNMLRVLNTTISGTRILNKKLIDGFNVLPPSYMEDVMKRVVRQRDIAVFGVKRNMYYYAVSEARRLKLRIPFRFIPGCLIRPHTTHFLFKRGYFLIRPFNRLLNRLFETGIASYWILHLGSNRILPAERLKGRKLRIQFLRTPFYTLFIGYILSCFVFVLELIYHRIKNFRK